MVGLLPEVEMLLVGIFEMLCSDSTHGGEGFIREQVHYKYILAAQDFSVTAAVFIH